MRTLAATLALLVIASGCGDESTTTTSAPPLTTSTTSPQSSSTTTTSQPDQPIDGGATSAEDAARAVLTADGDPAQACGTFVTAAFIRISYGGRKNCLAARRTRALADSIEIRSSSATETGRHLVVVPSGGPYDGARLEVEVLADGDSFRVDSLQAHIPAGP